MESYMGDIGENTTECPVSLHIDTLKIEIYIFFLCSSSGTKDTVVENGAGGSTAPKKLKKRRLKEEVKLWEESRRCCSGDQRSDTDAAEALPKKGTVESTGRPTHHTLLH
jgi:hypothetical protein